MSKQIKLAMAALVVVLVGLGAYTLAKSRVGADVAKVPVADSTAKPDSAKSKLKIQMSKDGKKAVLTATIKDSRGYVLPNPNVWVTSNKSRKLELTEITSKLPETRDYGFTGFAYSKEGKYWIILTSNHIYKYDGTNITDISGRINANGYLAISEDGRTVNGATHPERFYISTNNPTGLYRFDQGGKTTNITEAVGLSSGDWITSIESIQGDNGGMCLGGVNINSTNQILKCIDYDDKITDRTQDMIDSDSGGGDRNNSPNIAITKLFGSFLRLRNNQVLNFSQSLYNSPITLVKDEIAALENRIGPIVNYAPYWNGADGAIIFNYNNNGRAVVREKKPAPVNYGYRTIDLTLPNMKSISAAVSPVTSQGKEAKFTLVGGQSNDDHVALLQINGNEIQDFSTAFPNTSIPAVELLGVRQMEWGESPYGLISVSARSNDGKERLYRVKINNDHPIFPYNANSSDYYNHPENFGGAMSGYPVNNNDGVVRFNVPMVPGIRPDATEIFRAWVYSYDENSDPMINITEIEQQASLK